MNGVINFFSQCGCWGRPLLGRKPPGEIEFEKKKGQNIGDKRKKREKG